MSTEDLNQDGQESAEEQANPLEMSDEDWANLDTEFLEAPDLDSDEDGDDDDDAGSQGSDDPDEGDDDDSDDDGNEDSEDEDEDQDEDDDDADGEEGDEPGDDDDAGDDAGDSSDDAGDDADDDGDDGDTDDGDADSQGDDAAVDPKTFFERVTAPFKANGREMKIDDPDDVIRLMQMGANYNRKMASMKPHLKLMKTLEKNEISEEKLNFLLDIEKGNPAAIAKLLKDSKIDPMEFDADQDKDYQATNYSPDDREIALDSVIEEIKDSETYPQTIEVVSNKWDAASKQAVAEAPELLRVINDHMASGIYDLISTRVEQDRVLGRLNGMSDIEAYRQIGDALHAEGAFDHLNPSQDQGQQKQTQQERKDPPRKKQAEKKRRDKRRAASPTKSAPKSKGNADFNPLSMSDEEYAQQFDAKYL